MVRVLIVENQMVPRQLFENILASSNRYQAVACVDSADAVFSYCARGEIDLLLMDVLMKDGSNGLDVAKRIKSLYPNIRIIIATALPDVLVLERARRIGVDAFWYKEVQRVPILEIMNRTMAGEHLFPDAPPAIPIGLAKSTDFTSREMDVLRLVCEGLTDREIAVRLFLSVTTVRYHVNNLISKTGFCSRTELAVHAVRSGIVIPGWG